MKEDRKGKTPQQIAQQLGIPHVETHIFLCAGPDCCSVEEGEAAWKALKGKVKSLYPDLGEAKVYRTRAKCLRICKDGPIAVAYPQGKWFQGVTAEHMDDVVEHLASGSEAQHPLEFGRYPLSVDGADDE